MKSALLLFTLFLSIVAAPYQISSFNTSETGFPVLDNAIITSTQSSGELAVLKHVPTSFKSGQLVMRVRYGVSNYTLYSGKINSATYDKLSAFRLPSGVSYSNSLKLKFYDSEEKMESQDMSKVYFDGSLIYTENNAKLYFKKAGKWVTLEKLNSLPGRLEITSNPGGATVTIDGVYQGKTPLSFVMDAPSVEVDLSKSGYYSQSVTATLQSGAVENLSVTLSKKVVLTAKTDPLTMIDTSITDISEAEALEASIHEALKNAKGQEKVKLANFDRTYPKLKPRDEFELPEEFADRKREYETKKRTERLKLVVSEDDYNSAAKVMFKHVKKLDDEMYSLYLPVNSMKLGKYDIYKFEFPVTMSVKQGPFDFTFSGRLPIPRDAARKFKFSSDEKGLKVAYGKRQVAVVSGGKKQKKYFKYGKLVLPFEGKEYELKGVVTLPNAINAHKATMEYFSSDYFEKACSLFYHVGSYDTTFVMAAVRAGHPYGKALLSKFYIYGYTVPSDHKKAESLLDTTIFKRFPPKNYWEMLLAIEYLPFEMKHDSLKKYSDRRYAAAMVKHAQVLQQKKEYDRALKLLSEAASMGCPNAMKSLGSSYVYQVPFFKRDTTLALKWYKKAAENGSASVNASVAYLYKEGVGGIKSYEKAMEWYKRGMNAGDLNCIKSIGHMYRLGTGVPQSETEALKWYQKLIDKGSKGMYQTIAGYYKNGKGFPKDYAKARQWYQKGVNAKVPDAMAEMGNLYLEGLGVSKNIATGDLWYEKAYQSGCHFRVMILAAYRYHYGKSGVKKNHAKAMKWYKRAYKSKSALACERLGNMYRDGDGVVANADSAIAWYNRSKELGNPSSIKKIAEMYQKGKGVAQNEKLALKYYKSSLQHAKYMDSKRYTMYQLGTFYDKGDGFTKNGTLALQWYKKAAALGSNLAMQNIGSMYYDGRGVTKNYNEAFYWYEKAAELGESHSILMLGICYHNGYGVTRNYYKAMEWYKKISKYNGAAMFNIALLYEFGYGVKKSWYEAEKWYRKSAEKGNKAAKKKLKSRGITL